MLQTLLVAIPIFVMIFLGTVSVRFGQRKDGSPIGSGSSDGH